MAYYNCVLISEDEIKQKYPNLLKDGYTSTDIKTEITSWQERQRRLEGNSYKYDTIPSEREIYNRIGEKERENNNIYQKGELTTEDKQIVYTPIGKIQQTYTVRRVGEGQYQIINKVLNI